MNCAIFFSTRCKSTLLETSARLTVKIYDFSKLKNMHTLRAGQRMFPRHPAHFHSKVRIAVALLGGSSSRRGITAGSEAANFPKLKLNHTAEKMITSPARGFPLHCMQKRAKSSHATLGLGGLSTVGLIYFIF